MTGASLFSALRALRNRDFALVWTGQTLSRIGDFIYQIVVAWWVVQQTGSAAVMGSVLTVAFLPVAVASIAGGVVVDRLPRMRVMLVSDLVRAAAVLAIAALVSAGRIELWMIYGLGLLFGVSDAFFQPAFFASVPELVPASDLPSANALTSMSFQLGRVVGPSIGGLLLASGGATAGLLADGLSFLVPAALVLPLAARPRPASATATPGTSWLTDLREGAATLTGHPVLLESLRIGTPVVSLLVGPFLVALPFLVAERFHDDPRILGFFLTLFPIGFILGSLWAGRSARTAHRGRRIFAGMAVAAAMLALFGLPLPVWALGIAALINGFALEIAGLAQTSATQELVPAERLGRVSSLQQVVDFGATPLAFGAASLATTWLGPGPTLGIGGAAGALLALLALSQRAVRTFD